MKPFYLYILRCGDDSLYVGHTDDLERRLHQHAAGELADDTVRRHPLTLVFVSEHQTRLEALEREQQIKGWTRAKKNALIRSDWQRLHRLAASRQATSADDPQPWPFDSAPPFAPLRVALRSG